MIFRHDNTIGVRHKPIEMHEVFRVDKFATCSDEGLRRVILPKSVYN